MKAVVQDRYGSAATLEVREIDRPVVDETSVLVKVYAASINAMDWRIMQGKPAVARVFFGIGFSRPKRRVRGVDIAGRVELVRKRDSRFKVGDEVFGLASGSFAEYVAADEREIDLKPPSVTFPQAATLGVAAFTALQGLRDVGHVKPGQKVLITGAGSGVGTFAVQIAKRLGAHVTAVTSTKNLDLARSLGADEVIDHTQEDFTRRPERYDVIFDISALTPLTASKRVLTPDGVFVIVGIRKGIGRILAAGILRRLFRYPIRNLMAKSRVEDFRQLGQWVEHGALHPVIDRTYPLSETRQAMSYVEGHQVGGKVVINVAPADAA